MLKIEIWPSFINQCSFELKEGEGLKTLLFIRDAYPHWEDLGQIDFAQNPEGFEKVLDLANYISKNPSPDTRIILDGVHVKMRLLENGKERLLTFRCPEENSPELKLIKLLFEMAHLHFKNKASYDYLELLGQYFFEEPPIKEYELEVPYRLKIFGGLTSAERPLLLEMLKKLRSKAPAILDMSNFISTGTILNDCFLSVATMDNVLVYCNKNAKNYLEGIGFDMNKVAKE
jgi:hypothetical protein